MNGLKGLSTLATILFLTGCTINVVTPQSDEMSSDEQDFLACELWIDGIGSQNESNPGTLTNQSEDKAVIAENITVLKGYLERLDSVDSTLALQVQRVLKNMLEHNEIHLETGEYPFDLVMSQLDSIGTASEGCEKLIGFELEIKP